MKYLIFGLIVFFTMNAVAQEKMELEWTFFHPKKAEWQDLGVKGSVQEALIESGEMPDPFWGENEKKFGWFEEYVWEFKSIIVLDDSTLDYEYNELVFNSIDTYGKIYVNDSLVLETDNAYMPHSVQIKDYLKPGINEVTVQITPPVLHHADMWSNKDYQLPAPNDVHEVAIAPYTRKPQYQFGWDWALRMNTIGFNKPVELFSYNRNRIVNKSVNILEVTDKEATVEFSIFLAVPENGMFGWDSEQNYMEPVQAQEGVLKRKVKIPNPKLWWPRGQGDQNLYLNDVKLLTYENELVGSVEFKYGIKTSELIQEKDEWGTSYYFKINGRTIFSKGGDYIPQDIFPARVKDEDIVKVVEAMADANFNMVRVWGGGYYPDEVFFETCDELGLMVWQDLMFACAMYPGDDDFISNVTKEFEYQVPRIAGHPSVVQFNGNNEVEVAWGNWGFQIKYGLYGKSAKEIEASYDRLFKDVAPNTIVKYTNIPYIHTSPLSNWGKMELYNHGSQHYWGVWHGRDPIEDFGKKIGRFNAEYGFQSFPEYSTIKTFADSSQWDLSSDVMKHHQKSYVGNDMILKHAKKLYGNPKDFEEFVYYSQLTQAMAVSMAVAGHRLDFPRCGGTLYWQVNDCWQAPTWSSIDYFGNWKALHYRVKDDYKPLTVLQKFNDLKDIEYYVTSDLPDTVKLQLIVQIHTIKGKHVETRKEAIIFNGAGKQKIDIPELINVSKCKKKKNYVIDFVVLPETGGDKPIISRRFTHIQSDYKKADEEDVTYSVNYEGGEGMPGTAMIYIESKKFLQDVWVFSDVPGLKFDKNFIHVLPGERAYIRVEYENPAQLNGIQLIWR